MYPYPLKYNWEKYTILIVEDDYSSVFYLKEVLKDTGVNIEIAGDGQSAVDICKNNSAINLVLMDIQLPLMNGLEATAEIKKIRSDLPVIAETAYATPYDQENCLIAGCNDFITKPIDSLELLEKINKYLG
jgi:CheY-like chemotaxis protein